MSRATSARATAGVRDRYDAVRALLDRAMALGPAEPQAVAAATPMVEAEARYLDARRFDDWLALYSDTANLWIPAHPDDHPGRDQAHAFDDRRRMSERAWRMHDPQAWALVSPVPVTIRQLGPVAAWFTDGSLIATATLSVTHVRRDGAQVLHGRETLELVRTSAALQIGTKILLFPEVTRGAPHLGWLM